MSGNVTVLLVNRRQRRIAALDTQGRYALLQIFRDDFDIVAGDDLAGANDPAGERTVVVGRTSEAIPARVDAAADDLKQAQDWLRGEVVYRA